ncbi:MAG: fadM 1 [Bacteroidetes bacterium]|nr:fadM 1 [Bacteroidota bacterium]
MIQFSDYHHITPVQVRFNDVDRLNHVNNATYLSYFELGRVQYFNKVINDFINWDEKGIVIARVEVNYAAPVFLNDDIYCCTKVIKTGTKSITIKNSIVKNLNGQIIECASGISILVAMDYVQQKSIPLPQTLVDLINNFEN